ncbi:MAG: hypothetical protein KDK70_07395, partial [Myxococcales bacterium]|nr:hypothetical protein [Myxococcales bacterium]
MGVGLTLGACKDDGGGQESAEDDTGTGTEATDDGADTTTGGITGTGDSTGEPPPEITWEFEDVFGVPNFDDDDENGQVDWNQFIFDGEDDHTVVALPAVPAGYSLELSMVGDLAHARAWFGQQLVGAGNGESVESATVPLPADEPSEVMVEFGDDYVGAVLTLTLLDPEGVIAASDSILLRSSPLILNHHLQPTEHVWVVQVDAGFGSNASMVAEYADVLGDQFTAVPGASYGFDV